MNIRQSIRNNLSRAAASVTLTVFVALAAPVTAYGLSANDRVAVPGAAPIVRVAPSHVAVSDITPGGLPQVNANSNTVKSIIQVVFGIIGAFAFMSIVASGFKYVTSAGDANKTSEAKKGVAFALVGLALAISAEAIVAFVVKRGAP